MKCCGAERTTPYCPSCGKQVMKPSPLVDILHQERDRLQKASVWLEECTQKKYNKSTLDKAKEEFDKFKYRTEALEEAMTNLCQPVKVMSDWLKENGFEEAGKALLGAFTGVPS